MEPLNSADREIDRAQQEVFDPPYTAYKLRLSGKSWVEVAKETGYKTPVACATAVQSWLQRAAVVESNQRKSEAVAIEIGRLDELQRTWWEAATRGDDKAAQIVLKVIAQRARLLGIDDPARVEDRGGVQKTILVTGSSKDFSTTLKEIAEGKYDSNDEEEDDD